jgi:hypothetical protein
MIGARTTGELAKPCSMRRGIAQCRSAAPRPHEGFLYGILGVGRGCGEPTTHPVDQRVECARPGGECGRISSPHALDELHQNVTGVIAIIS